MEQEMRSEAAGAKVRSISWREARFQRVQCQSNTLKGGQRGRQPGLEVQFCLEAAAHLNIPRTR